MCVYIHVYLYRFPDVECDHNKCKCRAKEKEKRIIQSKRSMHSDIYKMLEAGGRVGGCAAASLAVNTVSLPI